MLCADFSNYSDPIDAGSVQAMKAAGLGMAIVQALIPPAGYPAGQGTHEQINVLLGEGVPTAFYAFWWHGAGTAFLEHHLTTLQGFEGQLVAACCDIEDTTIGAFLNLHHVELPQEHLVRINRQAPPHTRMFGRMDSADLVADIATWHQTLVQFPTTTGDLIDYSGPWYWGPYLGNPWDFSQAGIRWWTAEYDGVQDTSDVTQYGGWAAPADLKQYVGSTSLAGIGGIDLSVLSDSYAARISGQTNDDPCADVEAARDGLVNALGYVAGDLALPIRKRPSRAVATFLQGLDAVADQQGIAHS